MKLDKVKDHYLKVHTLRESLYTINWTTDEVNNENSTNKRSDYDLSL